MLGLFNLLNQTLFSSRNAEQRAQKYEPTDGHYANKCADLLAKASCNPLGDRMGLFSNLLFCWAIGNADNHLKNYSLLWSDDWQRRKLSPFYDLTCTLIYPHLEGEMGVSLCPSRRIDEVGLGDIVETARGMGVGKKAALAEYGDLCHDFEDALRRAEAQLVGKGFDRASEIADFISHSFKERCVDLERG